MNFEHQSENVVGSRVEHFVILEERDHDVRFKCSEGVVRKRVANGESSVVDDVVDTSEGSERSKEESVLVSAKGFPWLIRSSFFPRFPHLKGY